MRRMTMGGVCLAIVGCQGGEILDGEPDPWASCEVAVTAVEADGTPRYTADIGYNGYGQVFDYARDDDADGELDFTLFNVDIHPDTHVAAETYLDDEGDGVVDTMTFITRDAAGWPATIEIDTDGDHVIDEVGTLVYVDDARVGEAWDRDGDGVTEEIRTIERDSRGRPMSDVLERDGETETITFGYEDLDGGGYIQTAMYDTGEVRSTTFDANEEVVAWHRDLTGEGRFVVDALRLLDEDGLEVSLSITVLRDDEIVRTQDTAWINVDGFRVSGSHVTDDRQDDTNDEDWTESWAWSCPE